MKGRANYLTIQEAAAASGVSYQTIYRRIKAGELLVIRNPRDRREKLIHKTDLERTFPHDFRAIAA